MMAITATSARPAIESAGTIEVSASGMAPSGMPDEPGAELVSS